MALKAPRFVIEGNEILLPSHADLVEGIDDRITNHIADFDQQTLDSKLDSLSSIYLGISSKAVDSSHADNADNATKATRDGSNNVIVSTYYKKTDTVDRAAADDAGNNFRQKYALQDGTYKNMSVGFSTLSSASSAATLDGANNNINTTYIKTIYNDGGTTTITFEKGDGSKNTFQTKDTTYTNATTSKAGLMSADMLKKLNALSTDTSSFSVSHSTSADKLSSARNINGIPFDGSANIAFHGTCDDASDVVQKTVTLPGYVSNAGNCILVRFSHPNSATQPTINVNGTGDRPIRRGQYNTALSNITRYNYQEVLFVDCSSYWRLVDNPTDLTVKLTGAVSGEAQISNDAFTVNTVFDPTVGMDSINLVYSDTRVFDSNNDIGDLDLLTESGFYRVAMGDGSKWNHYPSGLVPNNSNVNKFVLYMQVFKSTSFAQSSIQLAFDMWGNQMYYRVRTQGTYRAWQRVNTTAVESTENVT